VAARAAARRDLEAARDRLEPSLANLPAELAARQLDASAYFAAMQPVFAFRARVRRFFTTSVDAAICPVTAGPAPMHGHWPGETVGSASFDAFNHTHACSLAGLPVSVVHAGEEDGMPIGVQIACGPYGDHLALALAEHIELRLGGAWRATIPPGEPS
jgi:Asp-tRNA(Asn)/Glu-tRNA(Gln) amidotransferase A subunit family amidase